MRVTYRGSGGIFVLVILGLISGLSLLLTDGLLPQIERLPEDPQIVTIEDPITPFARQNLQMEHIGIKATVTPSPTPTVPPGQIPSGTPPVQPTVSPSLPPGLTPTQTADCPNNLLVNPSFEVNSPGTNPPTGWGPFGHVFFTPEYILPDGVRYVGVISNNEMRQRVPVTAGARYSLTFYSASHIPGVQTVTLEYRTSSNAITGTPAVHTIQHDVDTNNRFAGPYTLSLGIAPSNAAFVQIRVRDNGVDYAKVDDFCLQAIS